MPNPLRRFRFTVFQFRARITANFFTPTGVGTKHERKFPSGRDDPIIGSKKVDDETTGNWGGEPSVSMVNDGGVQKVRIEVDQKPASDDDYLTIDVWQRGGASDIAGFIDETSEGEEYQRAS